MHEQANRPRVPSRRRSLVDPPQPSVTVQVTCVVDGLSHRITDLAFGAGHRHGRYQALCGHAVTAAAMICPGGQPCPFCAQHARRLEGDKLAGARHRRRGTFRRLVGRRRGNGTGDDLVRRIPA
jgi:hypothetical protein